MRNILVSIGGFHVYSYGFAVALAVLLGIIWVGRTATNRKIASYDQIIDLAINVLLGGIIGARLLYVLLDLPFYLQNPITIFYLSDGGLSFYGAVIGGFLTGYRYTKKTGLPLWKIADVVGLYIPIGYSIARVGCLLHGCCYGVPTNLPWALRCAAGDNLLRHPTQIYSIIANLLLFTVLWFYRRHRYFDGFLFWLYVELYVITRFIIEIYRDSQILAFGWLRTTQAACLIVAVAVLIYMIKAMKNKSGKVSDATAKFNN